MKCKIRFCTDRSAVPLTKRCILLCSPVFFLCSSCEICKKNTYQSFIIYCIIISVYLPPANEVWGKVIFSEACVKNSVHRGGVPDPPPGPGRYPPPGPGRYPPRPGRYTPPDQAGTPPRDQAGTPPPGQAGTPPPDQAGNPPPRDTVNARAVRILLEWNLVWNVFRTTGGYVLCS